MPNPQVEAIIQRAREAGYDDQQTLDRLEQRGVDVSEYRTPVATPAARPLTEKLGNTLSSIFSGQAIGNYIGTKYEERFGKETQRLREVAPELRNKTIHKAPTTGQLAADVVSSGLSIAAPGLGKAAGVGAKGIFKTGLAIAKREAAIGAGIGATREYARTGEIGDAIAGGFTGGVIGGAAGAVFGGIGGRMALKKESERLIKQGIQKKSVDAAQYALNKGKVVVDKVAKTAIKSGIEPKYVNLIKTASEKDKGMMRKMFTLSQRASKDLNIPDRPIEQVGEAFTKRIKFLYGKRQAVGKKLGQIVKNAPTKKIPVDNIYGSFVDDLAEANVGITKNGLKFANSEFINDPSARKLLTQTFLDLKKAKTAREIHILRNRLFNDLDLATKGSGLSSNSERILSKVRANLGTVLEETLPAYKKKSVEYAKLQDVLTRFNKTMGVRIESSTANLRAGEVMRRLLSNASAKPLQLVLDADDLVKYFGKKNTANLRTQVIFADLMEDVFGLQQPTSLGGQVQRANERILNEGVGVVEDMANANVGSLARKGITKVIGKLTKMSPEKQQEAIAKLIGL